jgi:sarcosine/dimethylglycine N-methyltransferase
MSTEARIAAHWTQGGLAEAIRAALTACGLDPDKLTVADLAPLDQFHGRGLEATRELAAHLDPGPGHHLLDIGCGIGGPARFIAAEYGCRVTGIDLTAEFCEIALMLNRATGLADKVVVKQATALALPFSDATFDAAYTQNVSMNIADKRAFYAEAARVVKRGGRFIAAEYAIGPGGAPVFPVPWARVPENSHLVSIDDTRRLLDQAGFQVLALNDRTPVMLTHYEETRRRIAAEGRPILGVHILLGDDAIERLKNSARSVEERRTVPIEVICRRL